MAGLTRIHKALLFLRTFVTLSVVLLTASPVWATRYIKDVMVVGGSKDNLLNVVATINNYRTHDGWTFIDQDLNAGAGGDYIYLLYKLDSYDDEFNYDCITDFVLSNSYNESLVYDGRTYYPASYDGDTGFKGSKGDLNHGTGSSTKIYLYYTRDTFPDRHAATGISFISLAQASCVRRVGGGNPYSLNAGTSGNAIYMRVSIATALEALRIGDGTAGTNTIPFYFGNSEYPYSISQQIYTAEEIGTAGTIKAIAFYHRLPDKSMTMNGVKIYMKHTEKTAFSGTDLDPASGFSKVFEGTVSATGSQWMTIHLDTPFEYDGNSNLMVCCYDPVGTPQPTGNTFTYHYADDKMRRHASHDSFTWEGALTGTAGMTMRNDIRFNIVPNPYRNPIGLLATNLTNNSASVSWSAPAGSHPQIDHYEWQYKKAEDAGWSALNSATGTTASLTGLSAYTEYMFRVKIVYSGNNSSSFSILRFVTAVSLPYTCGFEDGMPGWSQVDYNHFYNVDYTGIFEEAAHSGSKSYRFKHYTQDPVPQYLISPGLPGNTQIAVSFYYKNFSGSSSSRETFQVGYSTTTKDINAFTWGEDITEQDAEWHQYQHSFPIGTQYIAVKYKSNKDQLNLDDFEFAVSSPYAKPTDLAVSELGETSVTLQWTAPDTVTDYSYGYQYKKASEDSWSTEASVTGTSITLHGLVSDTSYDFRVKTLYGSNASNYVTLRFMTEGPAVSIPHTQDFESGMGGWRLENGHGRSGISTREKHGGSYSFEFDEGAPEAQFLRSPRLNTSSEVVVSFSFKNFAEVQSSTSILSYASSFQVGWSTNTNKLTDFVGAPEEAADNGQWTRYSLQVPGGAKYVLIKVKDHAAWLYVDDISITEVPKPVATAATVMGETRYVTTFYDSARNWQLPEGAWAYTAAKEGNNYVFYCLDDLIPAGVPVIILMDKTSADTEPTKEIKLSITASTTSPHPGNVLTGTDSPINVSDGKIGGKTVYVLGVANGELGFYPFSGSQIPGGKAYYLVD